MAVVKIIEKEVSYFFSQLHSLDFGTQKSDFLKCIDYVTMAFLKTMYLRKTLY